MKEFDINKIKIKDLLKAFLISKADDLLKELEEQLNLLSQWQGSYFNWGRNALFSFFKYLKYKEIVFPAFTCPTLTEAAERAGKKVVLSEIDLDTFNLDISKIPRKTKCLYAVHTFGNPLDIAFIRKRFQDIYIIEDCAHALFSQYQGKFVGNQGDAILFSLYKQIANINGALLLTKEKWEKENRNKELNFKYLKRLIFKTRGPHQVVLNWKRGQYLPEITNQTKKGEKPSNLVLALFKNNLSNLKKEVIKRRQVSRWYFEEAEKNSAFFVQKQTLRGLSSYYFFNIRLKPEFAFLRDELGLALRQNNIFPGRIWYDAPVTDKKYEFFQKKCPNALLLAKTFLNLPISAGYQKKDVKFLFKKIKEILLELRN